MEELFNTSLKTIALITATAFGIYLAVIVLTRISGKRSFSKMSSFDFAMTVAIGSIVATTILSSSVKLIDGIVGLIAVYLLQKIVSMARRSKAVQNIVDNSPILLMDGETMLESNMEKSGVTVSDLRSKLREANVTQLNQIKAVVFETTGDISVLHEDDDQDLNEWIMDDVQRH